MNLKRPIEFYLSPLLPISTDTKALGRPTLDIQCILFDIYGTLFISGSGDIGISKKSGNTEDKLSNLLQSYAINKPAETILKTFFNAIEAKHLELIKKGIEHPEVVIEKIWMKVLCTSDMEKAKSFALEYELISNPVWPMPGLSALIADCKKQGIAMGIISNAQFYTPFMFQWFLKKNLEDLGFDADLLFFSYKILHAKPSLHMFDLAKQQLAQKAILPKNTLYLGNDMLNDML
ncbi:MAG: HAD family hydrolase, partial [Desulfobacteraceae bacterium]|nr:HAD family hydrolase [Desulfobacteraceae bacterium]